jgi:hypothetical protein
MQTIGDVTYMAMHASGNASGTVECHVTAPVLSAHFVDLGPN